GRRNGTNSQGNLELVNQGTARRPGKTLTDRVTGGHVLAKGGDDEGDHAPAARGPLRQRDGSAALDGVPRLRQDLEEVTDDAEVDELEDRRLLVLVDRDDRLGGLHAGAVLDRAGDARRDVQLRGDLLAGLADLRGVRVPTGVDRGTRGTDGGTEGVREGLDRAEVTAGAAAAGDDDRRLGQLGAPGLLLRLGCGDPRGLGLLGDAHGELLEGAGAARLLRGGGVRLDADDRRALGDLRGHRVAAGEDRLRGDRALLDVDGVGDQAGPGLHREAGTDLLATGVARDEH